MSQGWWSKLGRIIESFPSRIPIAGKNAIHITNSIRLKRVSNEKKMEDEVRLLRLDEKETNEDDENRVDSMLITTDGIALYGEIPTGQVISDNCSEYHLSPFMGGQDILIPANDVAGIRQLPVEQETQNDDDITPLPPALIRLSHETIGRSERLGYDFTFQEFPDPVGRHFGKSFDWGDINFNDDTPLYCDWEHLARKQSGLNSIGAGAFGFSLSAGWDDDLWELFSDLVDRRDKGLSQVIDEPEAAFSGYPKLISKNDDEVIETMEGSKWVAVLISDSHIDTVEDIEDDAWVIVFFKQDSLMFPMELWSDITDQIKIYGEVVSVPFDAGFGSAECFVKARAAAYFDT